jgi:opacity protein-like surface antigen
MKKTILFLLLSSSFLSNAQLKENFKKGWILNKNGTKTEGHIRLDDIIEQPSSVCFKINLDEKKCQNYNSTQIESFKLVDGDKFTSLVLRMDNGSKEISAFAKLILESNEISIYKSSYNSETFYILQKNKINYVLQNDKFTSRDLEVKKYNFKRILNFVTEGLVLNYNSNVRFKEDYIFETVVKYNELKKVKTKDLRTKNKSANLYLISAGSSFQKDLTEYSGQFIVRKYSPKISKSTSLNFGVNQLESRIRSKDEEVKLSIFSIPFYIQQNILNKNVRPYIFTGASFNFVKIDHNNNPIAEIFLNRPNRMSFLYGAGLEIDIYKGIYLKSEYRVDLYSHPVTFGIGYIFNNN